MVEETRNTLGHAVMNLHSRETVFDIGQYVQYARYNALINHVRNGPCCDHRVYACMVEACTTLADRVMTLHVTDTYLISVWMWYRWCDTGQGKK
jgi:hypothetical protein